MSTNPSVDPGRPAARVRELGVVLACCALAVGPACAGTPGEEIAAVNAQFMARFAAGDGAALSALFTEDAQVLPANNEVMEGRPAIAAFWQAVMDEGVAGATLETAEVLNCGGAAYEMGRYVLHDAEGAELDHGKYLVIWVKTVDGWRLHRDIFNSSVPPGAR